MTPPIPQGLLDSLCKAGHVVVLTGAGVSAESGVPTFRDAQSGLWARYQPEELATPEAFRRNPRLVWDWYTWRRELVAALQPNPGHYALAEMARYTHLTLITQNVDGLHQKAGSPEVIELHGNLQRVKCQEEDRVVESWGDQKEVPPRCPRCGGLLRPDVVWFGEALPQEALESAWAAAESCELFFSVGTSSQVQPAASLPYLAYDRGVPVIEINPNETTLTPYSAYFLRGRSGEILPELVRQAWRASSGSPSPESGLGIQ